MQRCPPGRDKTCGGGAAGIGSWVSLSQYSKHNASEIKMPEFPTVATARLSSMPLLRACHHVHIL